MVRWEVYKRLAEKDGQEGFSCKALLRAQISLRKRASDKSGGDEPAGWGGRRRDGGASAQCETKARRQQRLGGVSWKAAAGKMPLFFYVSMVGTRTGRSRAKAAAKTQLAPSTCNRITV